MNTVYQNIQTGISLFYWCLKLGNGCFRFGFR